MPPLRPLLAAVALAAAALPALAAARVTVCTVTVNSNDEREAFRRNLPAGDYDFVELVERGRPDWLASACARHVSCDVLLVSGHFAGTEFYSSRPEVNESLGVDEIERASCGGSCPDLFSHLREVYLFGCDSLKTEPARSAMPEIVRALVRGGRTEPEARRVAKDLSERYGEDARDRMRRIFPNVPVIYGFSSLAPYGRVAGPLLQQWFDQGGASQVGSGRPSERLLKLFGPASMVATAGRGDGGEDAAVRAEACRFYDDRPTPAQKLAVMREALAAPMPEARMAFDRVEKFFASLTAAQREEPAFVAALAAMADDGALRERYLAIERDTAEPTLRLRMIALAGSIGWLPAEERRAERVRLVADLFAAPSMGFGDVDLICTLNGEGGVAEALARVGERRQEPAARAAARACLGSAPARARVLHALASADEDEVRIAQAYLRHQPIRDAAELRTAAAQVARIANAAAQVRALETLARFHIDDASTLASLAALFESTKSLAVQRAIAEVFLRADRGSLDAPRLAQALQRHRLPSRQGHDLIDTLIGQLQAQS